MAFIKKRFAERQGNSKGLVCPFSISAGLLLLLLE